MFLKLVKNIVKKPEYRFVRPTIVALIEIDVVSRVRKDSVDVLFIRRNIHIDARTPELLIFVMPAVFSLEYRKLAAVVRN